jgi:hypothetical protein
MSATGKIDPRNPPHWIKALIQNAAGADGLHLRAEARRTDGAGGATIVVLGAGTFAAPLPVGWSFHRGRPYEGRIRPKEGYDIHFRIDSHEDAAAAAGGEALMRYAGEPEFKDEVKTPREILNDFLISIPGKDPSGRDIVWKCVEPFRGTHVRELVFRCPLVNEELVEHRVSIARAISEWMNLGRFSPEATPLDRVAHAATLERVNFQDTILMRVPRGWKVEDTSETDETRKLYAVDHPEDRETIWVTSLLYNLPDYDDVRVPQGVMAEFADRAWRKTESKKGWLSRRQEQLEHGDLFFTAVSEEEERGRTLRRITWTRWAIRDDVMITGLVHLVTGKEFVDEPEQIERAETMEREARNAIFLMPPV